MKTFPSVVQISAFVMNGRSSNLALTTLDLSSPVDVGAELQQFVIPVQIFNPHNLGIDMNLRPDVCLPSGDPTSLNETASGWPGPIIIAF